MIVMTPEQKGEDEARGVVRLQGRGGVAELVAGAGSGEGNIISSTGEIFSAEKLVNSGECQIVINRTLLPRCWWRPAPSCSRSGQSR